MKNKTIVTGLAILLIPFVVSALTKEAPDAGKWNISLEGTWQFAPENSQDYQPAPVPGFWNNTVQSKNFTEKEVIKWKSGSYQRNFTTSQINRGTLLDFEMVRWGCDILINGKKIATQDLGYSPIEIDVTSNTKTGKNKLKVITRGWTSLDRYKNKDIQIPTGAGNWFGKKEGGIAGYVTMRTFNNAYIGTLNITPHIIGPSCDITTDITAGAKPWRGKLAVQVVSEDGTKAFSSVKRQNINLKAKQSLAVSIKNILAEDAKLWWPENPTLYRLVAWLEPNAGNQIDYARDDIFGFREISKNNGRFHINGKPMVLFGATELIMYDMLKMMQNKELLTKINVNLFKQMNGTAVRTHMNPLPRRWLDMCDRGGLLVFPEFPNFPDVQRKGDLNPYDLPLYWKNLQREIVGMIKVRHNHPSIIGWSISNEGNGFGDWERKNLVPFVKSIDPTRLVMLSADITEDIADSHNFLGLWWGTQTDFERLSKQLANAYPDRIVGNTEYGQFRPSDSWYGPYKPDRNSDEFIMDFAMLRMEQTETFRRLRYDIIMPYNSRIGKARETGKYEDVSPIFHAQRNAFSPLGVSIARSGRHATAGTELRVPICIMSDGKEVSGKVHGKLYLLKNHPGFDWNGSTDGMTVLAKSKFSVTLKPWQAKNETVSITLPKKPGNYMLASTINIADNKQPGIISLRPLRLFSPLPPLTKPRIVSVIERGDKITKWLKARGHKVVLPFGEQRPDVIIIGDNAVYNALFKQQGYMLGNRVKLYGSRMVILEQDSWDTTAMHSNIGLTLDRLTVTPLRSSVMSLFPEPGAEKTVGSYKDYKRLNGVDNIALRTCLIPTDTTIKEDNGDKAKLATGGTITEKAAVDDNPWQSLISAFGRGGAKVDWALAHKKFGKGEVIACQIPLTDRLNKSKKQYDPVAERLMAFLIEGTVPTMDKTKSFEKTYKKK